MSRMVKIAAAYLKQAGSRMNDAERALKDGNHPYSLRLAQECVELSLKASLKLVGVEYPKVHDVSDVLLRVRERFPDWFKEGMNRMAETSKTLVSKREIAFYGSKEEHITPEEVIGKEEAKDAVDSAKTTYRLCRKLLASYMQNR